MHRQTGETQALGTILLQLEFRDLWLAERWFPPFAALLNKYLRFILAPGDLDLDCFSSGTVKFLGLLPLDF